MCDDESRRTEETARKYGLTHEDMIGIVCGLRPDEFYGMVSGGEGRGDGFEDKTYAFVATRRLKPVGQEGEEDVTLYIAFRFRRPPEEGAQIVSFREAEREVTDSERHIRR